MSPSRTNPRSSTYRWRVASGFFAIVTFTVIAGYYVPTYREAARLRSERAALQADRVTSDATLERQRAELARLEAERERLKHELDTSKRDGAALARRIHKIERLLSAQFGRLVQANMMVVSSADDRISVALAVPALFSPGERLTPSGRSLLCELAKTIMAEYGGQIRVTGYYGRARLSAADVGNHHATPWHLSAARAASAAQALVEDCNAPADRFLVVGYGPRAAGPLGENVALEFILQGSE